MQKSTSTTRRLIESAVMLALATVLSLFKLVELPYGGSVTFASMLPIAIIAYRYGCGWGLITGLVFGAIQQLLGLKNLSYFSTWYSIVAIIGLDYLIAFGVIGFAGAFRRMKSQPAGLLLGCLLAGLLRYLCHVISGATVWAGLSIPTAAALTYSFVYNATYMIPEVIVLLLVAYYVGSSLDFRQTSIAPYQRSAVKGIPALRWVSGIALTAGLVFITVTVFGKMQNAETGEFDVTALNTVNWTVVLVVGAVSLVSAVVLFIASRVGRSAAPEDKPQ